ncbi:MAG: CvpA family protein [Chloroflexi bacterium]|nr:CvpA family protein [Chloroflexota bacterium]
MNWLDIAILATMAWFTFTSLFTGMIREALTIAGMLAGVVLAGKYYTELAPKLSMVPGENGPRIVAFLVIFIVIMLVAHAIGSVLQQMVDLLFLGWLDHLGGAVIGFAKGILIVEVLLFLFLRYPAFNMTKAVQDSKLAQQFLDRFPLLLSLLPSEFDSVRNFFR